MVSQSLASEELVEDNTGAAFIIPILHSLFVTTADINVLSEEDKSGASSLGYLLHPKDFIQLENSRVIDRVISSTITASFHDKYPNLWHHNQSGLQMTTLGESIQNPWSFQNFSEEFFVTNVPIGSDGGLLRSLVPRINTSIACALVSSTDFPSVCTGDKPYSKTFSYLHDPSTLADNDPYDVGASKYRARICIPGNTDMSPWKDTPNRQDIAEDFWLDYTQKDVGFWTEDPLPDNYTLHCSSNSTLGYFEIPNHWNGHVIGPLLDAVPTSLQRTLNYYNAPYFDPNGGIDTFFPRASSPFISALMGIFGPRTFFDVAGSNSDETNRTISLLCSQLRYPFAALTPYDREGCPDMGFCTLYSNITCDYGYGLRHAMTLWMFQFGNHTAALQVIDLATWAAADIIMNSAAERARRMDWGTGAQVLTTEGTPIQKPDISAAGIITLSVLLALQITGLAFLALYASRRATWTRALDSWAMLRLGAEIAREDMPAVSSLQANKSALLDQPKGWIGDVGAEGNEEGFEVRELGLGGREKVREGTLYRMTRMQ